MAILSPIFTPASQVLERHAELFTHRKIIIAGDIQDDYPTVIKSEICRIQCTQFHTYLHLQKRAPDAEVIFTLNPKTSFYDGIDTIIYYWPKNKREAQFELANLLSNMPPKSEVFIVGENRTGVKSAESLLTDFGKIQKIDSARRCGLYHFELEKQIPFDLTEWWQGYNFTIGNNQIKIESLPGVFSAKELDGGSDLLLKALIEHPDLIKGDIVDIGSGAAVLGTVIGKLFTPTTLTLSDVSVAALASSSATLAANQVEAKVVASDVFSHLPDKYHLIISNPPFHDGKQTSYVAVDKLIKEAKKHLKLNGYLCIVANAFLPYQEILAGTFKQVDIIAQNSKFKVYLASH
ncbi:16S rRNA (guanine(1207)-N(2))-methyltransferase RsmC [Orbaceae bacterium ESL0721]|nr:16S rRNA (guanine(1207)-N(2))-methyltransferase RsmC [Orbaceae bacterium ESL0721]